MPSAAPALCGLLGTSGRCVEDMPEEKRMRSIAQVLIVGTVCLFSTPAFAQGTPGQTRTPDAAAQQLRRDLESMKEQMRQMQEKIQQQEEAIEKLSTPAAPPVALHLYLRHLLRATANNSSRRCREEVMRDIQPNSPQRTRPSPRSSTRRSASLSIPRSRIGSTRATILSSVSAELGLSASIDPFARGYAIFNGTSDGFEVEEAAIVTTSLPYNLTVKGGRFFADFGRLSKFHDHDLPFVNRPVVLDRFVGGESQADGVEVSYLLPIEQYVTLTAGMYNKIGAENDRVSNTVPRDLGEFTYLGRAATFISLSDAHSIDLGAELCLYAEGQDRAEGRIVTWLVSILRTAMSPSARPPTVVSSGAPKCSSISENRPVGGFPDDDPTIPPPIRSSSATMPGEYTATSRHG